MQEQSCHIHVWLPRYHFKIWFVLDCSVHPHTSLGCTEAGACELLKKNWPGSSRYLETGIKYVSYGLRSRYRKSECVLSYETYYDLGFISVESDCIVNSAA